MAPYVDCLQKMASNICRKVYKDVFLEVTPKKGLHDLCGTKFVGKSGTKLFGQVSGNSGKKLCTRKKLLAPTPMTHSSPSLNKILLSTDLP